MKKQRQKSLSDVAKATMDAAKGAIIGGVSGSVFGGAVLCGAGWENTISRVGSALSLGAAPEIAAGCALAGGGIGLIRGVSTGVRPIRSRGTSRH